MVKLQDLEFEPEKVEHWASFKPEVAVDSDGNSYLRGKGSPIIYKKSNGGYVCVICGSEIMGGRVAHSIHDGPWIGSGSGQCHYEQVPYCPKCEKAPDFHGLPIRVE